MDLNVSLHGGLGILVVCLTKFRLLELLCQGGIVVARRAEESKNQKINSPQRFVDRTHQQSRIPNSRPG